MTTMLRNFDTDLDTHGVTRLVREVSTVSIIEEVKVTHRPTESVTHLLKDSEQWGWSELRDYVVAEIEKRFGQQPSDGRKEKSIFTAFIDRWGDRAALIARFAFEGPADGWWHNAPISVNRFCKNSDPYFSIPIAERLHSGSPIAGW